MHFKALHSALLTPRPHFADKRRPGSLPRKLDNRRVLDWHYDNTVQSQQRLEKQRGVPGNAVGTFRQVV